MNFMNSATKKEMLHAMNEVKQIMYKTKKRVHCKWRKRYTYYVFCPCKNCDWKERIKKNFEIDDIRDVVQAFLFHLNTQISQKINYEHIKLAIKIFGSDRVEKDLMKYQLILSDKLREIDKYFFLKDYEKVVTFKK